MYHKIIKIQVLSVIFRLQMCLRGRSFRGIFNGGTSPLFHRTERCPCHSIFPQDNNGQRSSEMILHPTPSNINRVPIKEALSFRESPRREVVVYKDWGSPKVIHPRGNYREREIARDRLGPRSQRRPVIESLSAVTQISIILPPFPPWAGDSL